MNTQRNGVPTATPKQQKRPNSEFFKDKYVSMPTIISCIMCMCF